MPTPALSSMREIEAISFRPVCSREYLWPQPLTSSPHRFRWLPHSGDRFLRRRSKDRVPGRSPHALHNSCTKAYGETTEVRVGRSPSPLYSHVSAIPQITCIRAHSSVPVSRCAFGQKTYRRSRLTVNNNSVPTGDGSNCSSRTAAVRARRSTARRDIESR
jgi:hypothetical protein